MHVPGWKPGDKKPKKAASGERGGAEEEEEAAVSSTATGDAHGLERCADTSHLSWFSDSASLTLRGRPIPNTAAHAEITFIGPGSMVMFQFDTPVGGIVMFQSHLPEAALRQRVRFEWFADPAMPKLLVW